MELKKDEAGNLVLRDDNLVYLDDEGAEHELDWRHAISKIKGLSADVDGLRRRAKDAETKLDSFSGIDDPEAARKALQTVATLDEKKLIEAGEVEQAKKEWAAHLQQQLNEKDTHYKKLLEAGAADVAKKDEQIRKLTVTNGFEASTFLAKKVIPALRGRNGERVWGQHFTVEDDGSVVARDRMGNKIYSKSRHGELAGFDEALEAIVMDDPNKKDILLAEQAQGTGATGSNPGSAGGQDGVVMSRQQARDHRAFRAAMENAEKQGTTLQIAAPPPVQQP